MIVSIFSVRVPSGNIELPKAFKPMSRHCRRIFDALVVAIPPKVATPWTFIAVGVVVLRA